MKNSSYYIAPVGVWIHDLPHTVASNMDKVSYALTHGGGIYANDTSHTPSNVVHFTEFVPCTDS